MSRQLSSKGTPSPASEFNECKINNSQINLNGPYMDPLQTPSPSKKKKSMLPKYLQEYKKSQKSDAKKQIPTATINIQPKPKPTVQLPPPVLINHSARLKRTRSILKGTKKEDNSFVRPKKPDSLERNRFTSKRKSENRLSNLSNQNPPKLDNIASARLSSREKSLDLDALLQLSPRLNQQEKEVEQLTPAFLRIYGSHRILDLNDLSFDDKHELMKSLELISQERSQLLENQQFLIKRVQNLEQELIYGQEQSNQYKVHIAHKLAMARSDIQKQKQMYKDQIKELQNQIKEQQKKENNLKSELQFQVKLLNQVQPEKNQFRKLASDLQEEYNEINRLYEFVKTENLAQMELIKGSRVQIQDLEEKNQNLQFQLQKVQKLQQIQVNYLKNKNGLTKDSGTQVNFNISLARDPSDLIIEFEVDKFELSRRLDYSSIHSANNSSETKFINLVKCKSDKRVSRKKRQNNSVDLQPDLIEYELIRILKALKNIMKTQFNNNQALMSKFQEFMSQISRENQEITIVQKQVILARKVAEYIYEDNHRSSQMNDTDFIKELELFKD